jgi:hypothetical protein
MNNPPIVFIHIAKTAGTSLLMMLRQHTPVEAAVDLTGIDAKSRAQFLSEVATGNIAGRKISDIRLIHGHIPYWVCLSIECRPLTLLRNPVELLASFYYYSRNVLSKSKIHQSINFVEEAVRLPLEDFVSLRDQNSICKLFCDNGEAGSDYSIELAKKNLSSMIFGISEEFSISSKLIFRKLGLPVTSPIQTNITPFKPELNRNERSFIEAHSPEDCELYQWAVGEFKERCRATDGALERNPI